MTVPYYLRMRRWLVAMKTRLNTAIKAMLWAASLGYLASGCANTRVKPESFQVVELREVSVDIIHALPGGTDPLITQNQNLTPRGIGNHLELLMDTSLFRYFYWDSRIHSTTDIVIDQDGTTSAGQFREVGLEMRLGVQLFEGARLGYYHHSVHLLDTDYSGGHFPVEDGLEFKFTIFRSNTRPKSVF